MRNGLKILIGAGGTMLLAWFLHGPLGQGHAFVADLGTRSVVALAGQGLGDVEVVYPDAPYARTAQLSGTVAPAEREKAIRVVHGLDGAGQAVWRDTGALAPAPAMAVASVSGPPVDLVDGAGSPAPAPVEPTRVLAAVSPPPPPMAGSCQRAVDAALAGRVVQFRTGSAWLNPEARRIIADVAGALRPCRGYALDVAALGTGNRVAHRAMALERASRVRTVLIEEGLPAAAITARGAGTVRHISFIVTEEGA